MTKKQLGLNTICVHIEHAEVAMIFGSGMAAISTAFLAFLKAGNHIVIKNPLYGGTNNFIREELPKYGIEFTFTDRCQILDFEKAIQPNIKLIHIETLSKSLTITDIKAVANLAKSRQVITTIDNTFTSPIIQNPIDLGIDIGIHSANKYLGGHSNILVGVIAASQVHINVIWNMAKNLGSSLSDFMVWMLERSMKTLALRVKAQSRNAKKLVRFLDRYPDVKQVYYSGLKSHLEYELAKFQMKLFGAMVSFELNRSI